MDPRVQARELFDAAVEAVRPDRLIRKSVGFEGNELIVSGVRFRLPTNGRLLVVGAGKASALMARTLEELAGERIASGLVIVKHGHRVPCRKIEIIEAGHPYPDLAGLAATQRLEAMCASATERDLVLCLLSGGGSALLADCPPEIEFRNWVGFSRQLVNSGASIGEINTVRKHLGTLKGGQLARITAPARLVCLILSDVVGDPLEVIASGPSVADPTTFADALAVLRRYDLEPAAAPSILQRLRKGADGTIPETPKPGDATIGRVQNALIGNNRMALEAALERAHAQGLQGAIVTSTLAGDSMKAAEFIVQTSFDYLQRSNLPKPFCLLFGGETTLRVDGGGFGGRNQHLALAAAKLLSETKRITLLVAGTDGTDGPTDAAGAIVDGNTWKTAQRSGLNPQTFLDAFDSYRFFQAAGGHVVTGPTMTNVMDVAIVMLS